MFELRPNCEICDKDLPPQSKEAWICTYECTYCARCVHEILHNVCPKCGGNFCQRPIRPVKAWRPERGLGLGNHPASTTRIHSPFTRQQMASLVERLRDLPPNER